MLDWRRFLYPELRAIPVEEWDQVLRKANQVAFSPAELVMIIAGVGAAALVVKAAGFRAMLGNPILGFAADFLAAGAVLLVIAGPFYWRRTRRGLRQAIEEKPAS